MTLPHAVTCRKIINITYVKCQSCCKWIIVSTKHLSFLSGWKGSIFYWVRWCSKRLAECFPLNIMDTASNGPSQRNIYGISLVHIAKKYEIAVSDTVASDIMEILRIPGDLFWLGCLIFEQPTLHFVRISLAWVKVKMSRGFSSHLPHGPLCGLYVV